MGNPFEAKIGGNFTPGTPEPKKRLIGSREKPQKKSISRKWYNFLKFAFLLFVVLVVINFLGLVKDGAFKSNINQEVNLQPNTTIHNNYSFQPETKNDYNFTIVNEINCPICNCS